MVTIDFQNDPPDLTQAYNIIGLETHQPILQIGPDIYAGRWANIVGTEMIFNEKGEWLHNVRRRLIMDKIEIKKKGDKGPTKSFRQMILRDDNLQNKESQVSTAEETRSDELAPRTAAVPQANDSEMVDIEQEHN